MAFNGLTSIAIMITYSSYRAHFTCTGSSIRKRGLAELKHDLKHTSALLLLFAMGTTADAALVQLGNPGFDSPPGVTEISDVTVNPITNNPAGTWVLGGGDGPDAWVLNTTDNVADNIIGAEAQGMTQWVVDGKATTGTASLRFDLRVDLGSAPGDVDLLLYVVGWDDGSNGPGMDYENGTAQTGDSFIPNASVNLITDTTGSEGVMNLVLNNAATTEGVAAGVVLDGSFHTVSVNLDFASGYDNIGVLFYGENDTPDGLMQIDNVQFVPEPTSFALLSLGGLLVARRRHK